MAILTKSGRAAIAASIKAQAIHMAWVPSATEYFATINGKSSQKQRGRTGHSDSALLVWRPIRNTV